MLRTALAVLLVLVVLVAGCADTDDNADATPEPSPEASPDPEPEPEPEPDPDPEPEAEAEVEDAAIAYFEAMATRTPVDMEGMFPAAAEGSTAHDYAVFQIAQTVVGRQEGFPGEPDRLREAGGSIELCSEEQCTEFGDFEYEDDLLASFTVNGVTIEGRFTVGDGTVHTAEGAEFEFVIAYEPITVDGVSAIVEIRNGDDPVNVHTWTSSYVGPDGRQASVSDAFGPVELRANASATYLFTVDGEKGGTLYLEGYAADDFQRDFEVPIVLGD